MHSLFYFCSTILCIAFDAGKICKQSCSIMDLVKSTLNPPQPLLQRRPYSPTSFIDQRQDAPFIITPLSLYIRDSNPMGFRGLRFKISKQAQAQIIFLTYFYSLLKIFLITSIVFLIFFYSQLTEKMSAASLSSITTVTLSMPSCSIEMKAVFQCHRF